MELFQDVGRMDSRHRAFMNQFEADPINDEPETLSDPDEDANNISVAPLYRGGLDLASRSWNVGGGRRSQPTKLEKAEGEQIVVSSKDLMSQLQKQQQEEDELSD